MAAMIEPKTVGACTQSCDQNSVEKAQDDVRFAT
jgi:hypothetical protein